MTNARPTETTDILNQGVFPDMVTSEIRGFLCDGIIMQMANDEREGQDKPCEAFCVRN